jgi:hypothetical protein
VWLGNGIKAKALFLRNCAFSGTLPASFRLWQRLADGEGTADRLLSGGGPGEIFPVPCHILS